MDDGCSEMRLLIQADVDHELGPAEAARVAAHVEGCGSCASVHAGLERLSTRLQSELPYHRAPEALQARIVKTVAPRITEARRPSRWQRLSRPSVAAPFGAGFALAASLALFFVLPSGGVQDSVVAGHIRGLQAGHLLDVVSTDQHTVKPWFNGRLDYAPPVKDLAVDGFPLAGGRLDYLAGHPIAVLVYQHRQHVIDVFVAPESHSAGPSESRSGGFNVLRWSRDGMVFWAVSDLNAEELATFAQLWQAS